MPRIRHWWAGTPLLLLATWFVHAAPPLPRDTLPKKIDTETIPLGLARVRNIPDDNALTIAKAALGRRLFFDPILSGDRTVSCASCHQPEHGFASPDKIAVGIRNQRGTRNAASLFNVAYGTSLFWDGRARTLEEQAVLPIANPRELGSNHAEVVRRLQGDPSNAAQFRKVFGKPITIGHVAQALASFQRTLLVGGSPVDHFHAGNASALTTSERQGLWIFESKGRCWKCHSGPNYSDGQFHNTGVSWNANVADRGRFTVTKQAHHTAAFKTPTLRGVARTAPYMHDGSLATLADVVRFYNKGGIRNPHLDPLMQPLHLSDQEIRDLVAFLQALSR